MQEFIVTGQVPGTEIYITFESIVAFVAIATGIYMLWAVVRSILAHSDKVKSPTTSERPEVQMVAESESAEQIIQTI